MVPQIGPNVHRMLGPDLFRMPQKRYHQGYHGSQERGKGLRNRIHNPFCLNVLREVERKRLELSTSALRMCEHSDASEAIEALTSTPPAACTAACTSDPKNVNAGTIDADQDGEDEVAVDDDGLAVLVALVGGLSPTERTRLLKIIAGAAEEDHTG